MAARYTTRRNVGQEYNPQKLALTFCSNKNDPDGFVKKWINDQIGYGVFTLLPLKRHEFVLQYPGKILTRKEGEQLEMEYPLSFGSFIFFMEKKCIDATNETRLGKYVNHSGHKKHINCYPKSLEEDGNVYICLFASSDIPAGMEIRYNYGITGQEWQKDPKHNIPFHLNDLLLHTESLNDDNESAVIELRTVCTLDVENTNHNGSESSNDAEEFAVIRDVIDKLVDMIEPGISNVNMLNDVILPDFSDSEDENLSSGVVMLARSSSLSSIVAEDSQDLPGHKEVLDTVFSIISQSPILNEKKLRLGKEKVSDTNSSINQDKVVSNDPVDFNISSNSTICEIAITNDSGLNLDADMECIDTDTEQNSSNLAVSINDVKKESVVQEQDSVDVGAKDVPQKQVKKKENKSNLLPRPLRPCFICKQDIKHSKLNRHITLCHKEHPEVKEALTLPRKERLRAFTNFRKLGIYSHNVKEIETGQYKFLREKKSKAFKSTDDSMVMCTSCKGFYAKTFKARHKAHCSKESCQLPVTIAVECTADESWKLSDDQFKQNILNVIRDDKVGMLAKSDSVILMVGHRLYGKIKRRLNKKLEVERSVRNDMRRLAHVYKRFKERKLEVSLNSPNDKNNAGDMFLRGNFEILKHAVECYTDSNLEVQKSGLKAALYYLLKDAAEKVIGHCLGKNNDDEAEKIKNFLILFKLRKDEIFSDATYDLNMRRNVKSKKPAQLPNEDDIKLIRDYVIQRIKEIASDVFAIIDKHAFVELRDCAATRLVLFNGRRGGEPSRLTIKQWIEAEKDEWLDKQRIKDIAQESNLGDGTKITFQSGKGVNHLVPVFIPKDTIAAMTLLANKQVRKDAGVLDENPYIFPSTQSSDNHCSGWHSLDSVCLKLPITNRERISGTANRHRLSTLIAGLGLSKSDMTLAYDHFGHSENINKTIYQAPAAHQQLLSTGKHLAVLDNGERLNKQVRENRRVL